MAALRRVLALLAATCASSLTVTIRNDVPRVDTAGAIVNAHDGSMMFFNNTYFLYGTVYENCTQHGTQCEAPCGYSPNTFALYTSIDLTKWTLQSRDILLNMTADNAVINYWMPVVIFNPNTLKFIMQYWSGRCGFAKPCADVAVADSPYGPFTMLPPLAVTAVPSSQMGFFADDNGNGYVRYNTGAPQHHVVQKLAPDWLSTTDEYAIVFWKSSFAWMEGGGVFKRGALWYYMTGTDCCFCTWGGDARFWTARSALGPWHPGVAPPLPTARCDLSGAWSSLGASAPGAERFNITQAAGSDAFTFADAHGRAQGSIDQATGYVTFPPSAGDGRGVVTSADGSAAGCDRVRWYGYEEFVWCRDGASCALPSYRDAPELNYCADGSMPHEDVRVNPCAPNDPLGTNFTIPAQQFNVLSIPVMVGGVADTAVLYYGERANSAPDGMFAHNYQAWVPLSFDAAGAIEPMAFPASFTLNITNETVGAR